MNVTQMCSVATVLGMAAVTASCTQSEQPVRMPPPPPAEEALAAPPQPETEAAPPQEAPSVTETVTAAGARRQIIEARCAYEQRCGRIGEGQHFMTSADCMDAVKAQWQKKLFQTCPGGVHMQALNECTTALRSHDCADVPAMPSDIKECDMNAICASQ